MPYTVENPPERIKGLPKHAIEIFVAAFNAAIVQYKGDEGKANATAWAAVKTKYEQKDDEWVAKESKGVPMSLQPIYAEIIQEAGKRNAASDAGRIKKIVELCQELLSSEIPDEGRMKEAIKEATATLAWLKEQELMKTEDGVKFPKEAFAYTPNAEAPATWKLLLWESLDKKVTKTQLGRASAALSPGGFRGQRVEIPIAESTSVKSKIRTEYRNLDIADEDIPRWVKESESRTILADYSSLSEAIVSSKGIATIVVIKPGLNSSKERFYSPETLKRDYKLFEGVKMYADHPTDAEDKARPERSIKDWVATLKNVHVDDKGQVIGEAVVVEPWLQAKLAQLRDQNMLQEMGVSINAIGSAIKGAIEGIKTNIIERIIRVRSVDFVTEAGAGGTVTMYEVDRENDVDLVNIEALKERRPDLVKIIETEVKAKTLQEAKKLGEQEEKITVLEGQITTLTTERDGLKTKITESEKAQRKAEAKSVIDKAVSESELPMPSKARLIERFKDAETGEGIAEAVKSEKDYVSALAEAGKVKGMGTTTVNPEKDQAALRESWKKMHPEWSDKQLETAVSGR